MNGGILPGATALVTNNLSRFLARLDRPSLEAVAEAAIDRLDALDGDADMELCGDEHDGTRGEDDFCDFGGNGAGCVIADSGAGDHEDEDAGRCGEFGIDQSRLLSRAQAFVDLNEMTPAEIALASIPGPRRRLGGTLGLRL